MHDPLRSPPYTRSSELHQTLQARLKGGVATQCPLAALPQRPPRYISHGYSATWDRDDSAMQHSSPHQSPSSCVLQLAAQPPSTQSHKMWICIVTRHHTVERGSGRKSQNTTLFDFAHPVAFPCQTCDGIKLFAAIIEGQDCSC